MARRRKSGEDPRIRRMRVQAWVRAVRLASGLSLVELEEEFSQRWSERSPVLRSCIWDKYQRGEVVPRASLQTKQGLSLVERVEKCYPGTAQWLSSPFWHVLNEAPMDMRAIREIYGDLPEPFRSIFVAPVHEQSELFWRRQVSPVDAHRRLATLRENDVVNALVATLAMIKEAETNQNKEQHILGVEGLEKCLILLRRHPVLGRPFLGDIYGYLEERWDGLEYFSDPDDKKREKIPEG